jgi:hypothetical protein
MNTKQGILLVGIALLVFCAFIGTASAKTWYVDDEGRPGIDFTNIINTNSSALIGSIDIPGEVRSDIAVSGNLALIATESGVLGIDITDPKNPSITGSVPTGSWTDHIEIQGNVAYAHCGGYNSGNFYTIAVSDPLTIRSLGSIWIGGFSTGIFNLTGNYAVILVDRLYYNELSYLAVVNITDPNNPTMVWTPDLDNVYGGGDIEIVNNISYLVSDGLHIFDVSELSNPTKLTSVGGVGEIIGVEILDNFAYIVAKIGGTVNLVIYDISDPSVPKFLRIVKVCSADELVSRGPQWHTFGRDFPIESNIAILGRYLINISNRTNPSILGSLPVSKVIDVKIKGNLAFVATATNATDKFQIFNISKALQIQPPIALFTYSPLNPVVNETITFNASESYDPDGGNITKYEWDFGDGNITNTIEPLITHFYALVGDYIVNLTITDDEGAMNSTNKTIIVYPPAVGFDTEAPANPYPSIFGTHNGTIKPSHDVFVQKMYAYSCSGTGGHTEYVRFENESWNITASWKGYQGDWYNITFDDPFTLYAGLTYNYTIRTGSYPQIHHNRTLTVPDGEITCSEFIDANGKRYDDWIPAIRLE